MNTIRLYSLFLRIHYCVIKCTQETTIANHAPYITHNTPSQRRWFQNMYALTRSILHMGNFNNFFTTGTVRNSFLLLRHDQTLSTTKEANISGDKKEIKIQGVTHETALE